MLNKLQIGRKMQNNEFACVCVHCRLIDDTVEWALSTHL